MDNSVNIEYLMGGDLIEKTKEAAKETGNLTTAAERAAATITEKIAAQKTVVKGIEDDLKKLEKQYEKMAPGKAQVEMEAELKACKVCLEEERGALSQLEAENKKASASVTRLTKEYRGLIQELARMRLAGEDNSEQYRIMSARAAELNDTLGDVRAQTKALASDDANWEAMASGLNGLSGAFTAGTGVMSLFVGENEELARIQTRLQSVMAITMGMQQVFNTLNRDSAFRVVAVTKAKELWSAANIRLATTLGISTAAATALMATITLGLSLAITGIIVLWNKWSNAQKKVVKSQSQIVAAMKDAARSAAVQKVKLDLLYKATQNHNSSLKDRKIAVGELQKQYPAYFGNMSQEAILAGKASEAYRQLTVDIIKAATARAYEKKIEKLAARNADLQGYVYANNNYFKRSRKKYKAAKSKHNKNLKNVDDITPTGDATDYAAKAAMRAATEATKDGIIDEYEGTVSLQKKIQAEMERNNRDMKILSEKVIANHAVLNKVGGTGYDTSTPKTPKIENNDKEDFSSDIKELADAELAAHRKIEETKIALMREGYDKERAEEKLQYEDTLQRINDEEKRRKELIVKLRKGGVYVSPEREAQVNTDAASQRVQAVMLYYQKITAINAKEKKEAYEKVKEEKEKEKEELDKLLDKYNDFNRERMLIEQAYTDDVKALQAKRTTENAAEIDAAIIQAGKAREKALKEVNNKELEEMKATSSVMVELFENSSDKSIKEIEQLMKKLEMLKAYMDAMSRGEVDLTGTVTVKDKEGKVTQTITQQDIASMGITPDQLKRLQESPEALKAFMDQWKKLKDETLKKNPFKALGAAIKDLLKDNGDKSGKEKKVKRLAETAAIAADEVGKIAGGLANAFEQMGNQSLAEAMGAIQDVMGGVSNIAKGFALGGIFGGVMAGLGEAINLFGKAAAANARHKKALQEIMASAIAQQREYNLLLLQQSLLYERGTTAFGIDKYGKSINAIRVMKGATDEFKKALKELGQYDRLKHTIFGSLWSEKEIEELMEVLKNSVAPFSWNSHVKQLKKDIRDISDDLKNLNNIRIVTGHEKTGLFGWGKGRYLTTGLLDLYPKLIDKNGELNVSLAESILKYRNMDEEAKVNLQNLVNLYKQHEEALKAIRDYLSDIFGELGNTIVNALTDAFKSGTDAGKVMVDSVGKMLEKLGGEMIYSAVLQKYFVKAQEEMERYATDETLSDEARFAAYANILDTLTSEVTRDSGKATNLLTQFKKMAKEHGISMYASEGQQGRSGSIETMTQEQGTKLEGLMTSAQIHLASIDLKMEDVSKQMTLSQKSLAKIEENTSYCQRLDEIADTMAEMKRNGIKVK